MFDTREDLFRESKRREYRQLELILKHIKAYQNGESNLRVLTASLETLLSRLNEVDEEWSCEYWEYFEPLLLKYDYSVVDNRTHFSQKELQSMAENINGIEQMVKERIKLYEPYLDDWDSSNF